MSTLERIECYLGAFESGTRSFWVDKKGVRCCFAPMGILGGFGAGGCVFFQTWGHTERNWKQGASQEITQWCAFPVKCEAVEIMHISLYQSVVDPCSSGSLLTPPPKSNYPQSFGRDPKLSRFIAFYKGFWRNQSWAAHACSGGPKHSGTTSACQLILTVILGWKTPWSNRGGAGDVPFPRLSDMREGILQCKDKADSPTEVIQKPSTKRALTKLVTIVGWSSKYRNEIGGWRFFRAFFRVTPFIHSRWVIQLISRVGKHIKRCG